MKVHITVCSGCSKEICRYMEDESNTREYQDVIDYIFCKTCQNSPAAKLLNAILGKSEYQK